MLCSYRDKFQANSFTHASVNKRTHEAIVYYPIHVLPLEDLLTGISPLEITNHELARFGAISYIPDRTGSSFLGKGGFKTAFEADLTLYQPLNSGLGCDSSRSSTGWTKVALKRPFELRQNGQAIRHLSLVDEGKLVLIEANMLAWAQALLDFAYTFIDHKIDTCGWPPFSIPRLRFVNGAVVFPQRDVDTKSISPISNRAVYLLEELIHQTELPFMKYIHNNDAKPLQDSDELGYDTGVFLCFIQHIQYTKTGKQVYISDCQGIFSIQLVLVF